MDVRETEAPLDKGGYATSCVYIKQLESINLSQLYRAMTVYLSFLTLPKTEDLLHIYEEHLANPFSWLNKAKLLAQAEAQRTAAKENAEAATSALDKALWEDAAKKLNYLIESWDSDVSTACQQIIQGISLLIHERIPLNEVQGEIIDFAAGRKVTPPVEETEEGVIKKLDRLLRDAQVNASSVLVKLARTVSVQADLFLNRLMQSGVSFAQLDVRQSFLFEANYKLCEFIEAQTQHLRSSLNIFSEKVAERITMRLNRIEIESVLQRYEDCAIPSEAQTEVFKEDKREARIETVAAPLETVPQSAAQEHQIPVLSSQLEATSEKLEAMLLSSEQLLENIVKQVSLHRLQLSCSSRLKACYGKFSLFPLFRHIATKLTHYHSTLDNSLSELTSMMDAITEMTEELKKRLHTVMKALSNNLDRIKTYLNTLDVHHNDYNVTEEIPNWQSRLHDFILRSSESELVAVDARLQRIASMDSPYLRATLIMKLDSARLKLNDMIIANMQSWSSRLVDRETVENTLRYLGIRIHPSHLNKIAPNIRISKKRPVAKKDFYSIAADYGLEAWKNLRAWLNKQAIG